MEVHTQIRKIRRSHRRCRRILYCLTIFVFLCLTVVNIACKSHKATEDTQAVNLSELSFLDLLKFRVVSGFSDTTDFFDLAVDSQRPAKRIVRHARATVAGTASDSSSTSSQTTDRTHRETVEDYSQAKRSVGGAVVFYIVIFVVFFVILRKL